MHLSAMDNPVENCQEIDADEVHFLESIGKGSFGVVYKALWRGLTVAVKKVETESEVNEFYNEVQQLARVQHENIIYLYGACTSGLYKCLVIEYADGGSLYHLLHNSPDTEYNLAHGISWLFQCAKAVSYLHSIQPRPLLHRDLKPPNLLLTKGAKVLKVCDFGTACELSTIMSDNRGSAAWMAPEVFEGKLYTEKCDVYSWGIILWEVVTRRIPFEDLGLAVRIMWAVHQKQRPPLITGCPKLLENLMKRCWDHNQARRPRMEEVVEKMCVVSRFLKGADDPINNPPSDDSITDSYRSVCMGGSSAGHTSRDVSELSCSTGDLPLPPPSSISTPNHPHHYHQHHHHHHHPHNDAGLSTLHNEDAVWLSSGSEGTYPLGEISSRDPSPQPPAPPHMNTVSSTVVVSGGRGSSRSSTASLDSEDPCTQPLAITIPGPGPPTRSDLALAPLYPPTISLTPIPGLVGGVSPSGVPLRQHLSPGDPGDPGAQLRRRSAEVSPQAPVTPHHGHRRSSSFGSVVRGSGDGQGGGGGGGVAAKGGEPAPPYSLLSPNPSPLLPNNPGHPPQHHLQHHHHHHHMPQYQIDPAMRDPGGSLGGVESALKYPDMPLLLPPTPSPSPSTAGATTTIAAATTATATSTAFPSWVPYPLYGPEPGGGGSHNGEGGGVGGSISGRAGGGSGGGRGPVEEELGAYWELLDAEIRPIKPVPTCPESQKIFNEHKEMAAKYLVLQHEIFNLRQRKTNLEEKLSQAEKLERIGNQRYQNKIKELESKKENLSRTRTRLRQQLEQIRARQEEQRQRQQQQQEEDTGGEPSLDLSLTPP